LQKANLKKSKDLAEARGSIYNFLTALFMRSPQPNLIESLRIFFDKLEEEKTYKSFPETMKKGFESMNRYLRQKNLDPDELAIDFTRLLRAYRPDMPLKPPYESVYRGDEQVYSDTTSKVIQNYRDHGLGVNDDYQGEPPDHIGIELDFMSNLCRMEAKEWEKGDVSKSISLLDAENRFLQEHILTWIYVLCDQIKKYGKTDFYRGLAELTESWVTFDNEQIDAIRYSQR
jgi:TorA maturation chaperone TorD